MALPPEDDTPGYCGLLVKAMYGTRDAAANWEQEYTDCLRCLGFVSGISTPCAFYNKERDVRVVVHGDDFTLLGTETDIQWLYKGMSERYSLKMRGILGPDSHDMKEITILNRVLRWTPRGLEYEADPRHAEILISELGLQGATATAWPALRPQVP